MERENPSSTKPGVLARLQEAPTHEVERGDRVGIAGCVGELGTAATNSQLFLAAAMAFAVATPGWSAGAPAPKLERASTSRASFEPAPQELPRSLVVRAVRAMTCVFKQVMAIRCAKPIKFEQNPLGSSCCIWWGALRIGPRPEDPECTERDQTILTFLEQIFAIPNDACRESALHGIGHWVRSYPALGRVVTKFMATHPNLDFELAEYAVCARAGMVE